MKKLTLIASLLFCGLSLNVAAETVFEWDFTNGLEGFTIYDEDGRKPNSNAVQFGFDPEGSSWIWVAQDKNYCAASNSTFQKMGEASDWLITPAIKIGESNVLSFDAATVGYKQGVVKIGDFSVFISTTGNAVEDFTTALAENEMPEKDWQNFGYDLSEYAGQTVYIAIVNVGQTKDALLVDNLFVGNIAMADIVPVYTRMQESLSYGQRITVDMNVGYIENVTSIEATLTCGDFTTTRTISDINLETGSEYSFQFNDALPAPTAGVPQVFEISALLNGKETVKAKGEILSQAYQPVKRVVCEEQTGTWCMWCVRGHVMMEEMEELYPDTYIGIASHINDVMQNYDYSSYLSGIIEIYEGASSKNGAPYGRVNRHSEVCDPQDFKQLYKSYIDRPAYADIALAAEMTADKKIKLTTTTTFALSASNLETRLEYIVLENDINVPGNNNYNQMNAYAGGSRGEMGGYENKPATVPAADMFYDDVVRRVVSDEVGQGIIGSVPTAVTQGEAYTHSIEMDVPTSVMVLDNCEFVVLLLDFATGEVLNAAKCSILNYPEAVEKVADDNARVYAAGGNVRVELNATAQVEVNVYATDGTLVYAAAPRQVNGQATIECPVAMRGVYLVNVVCDGAAHTYKVVL